MSRWFRFYDGALDDPKVQRLPPDLFKAWVNILCLASRSDGVLPDIEDMAFALRVTRDVTRDWVDALRSRGLIDVNSGDETMSPHNWNSRQFKSDADPTAAERQRRKRAKAATLGENSGNEKPKDVTRDVTPPRTETETEQNKKDLIDPSLSDSAKPNADEGKNLIKFEKPSKAEKRRFEYPLGFQQFWSAYPTDANMSKTKALAEWNKLSRPEKDLAIASMTGFCAYCRSHADYRPIHAERYLKHRRFEGHADAAAKIANSAGIYVRVGTPAWGAWEAHYRRVGKGALMTDKAGNGWYFPSEFPPEVGAA